MSVNSHPIPDAVLAHHVAILGKTGSGKTSTEKLAVEQVVAAGFRVCVLDTIKSDWWGITSSADGKRPGLPFQILGGPRGHVPLHSSAGKVIGQLVGAGTLPLSIIDMADFEAGGLQRFFIDFAPALMRHARGVVYLVIEEAHELAPKEKSGVGNENMAIHWAKKLATAGRSKGIRLIVATQRIQALHNAVLGSCETVIAHRLTTPADQEPVVKWLKANTDKETVEKVAGSLSSLPTGTGWICSGEARIFEMMKFPKFKTYDNTATPTGDSDDQEVVTAQVDREQLRVIIGDAVKQAEADDPKALRAEIAKLKADLAKAGQSPAIDPKTIEDAKTRGYDQGVRDSASWLAPDLQRIGDAIRALPEVSVAKLSEAAEAVVHEIEREIEVLNRQWSNGHPGSAPAPDSLNRIVSGPSPSPIRRPSPARAATQSPLAQVGKSSATGDGGLKGPEQRILNSLASWRALGHETPMNAQVAWLARYSPSSTSYTNPRSALKTKGLIAYPSGDCVALTDDGAALAVEATINGELAEHVLALLPGPERRILSAVMTHYPDAASNEDAAQGANYSATSTSYTNPRSSLRSKELITYPSNGQVRAADWLFAEALAR